MCKLLVRMADKPGNATKRFDVIDVREDTVPWGNLEGYPTYLRVSLPGISVDQARFLTDVEFDPTSEADIGGEHTTAILHTRAWHVVESRINPPILAQIEAAWMVSGEYEIADASGMLAWLEKKIDGSGKGSW